MSTTGKCTKEFRLYLGLNQTQFAEKLGITQQAVQRVESDNGNFNIDTLNRLSTILNVNLNWLLTGNGEMLQKAKNTLEIKYSPLVIDYIAFGKRLNKIRVHADMITREMSMLLEIKEDRFSDLCIGKKEPTLAEIAKICENFEVTADWLMFGKE